jgi:hypothetical protein
VCSECPEPRTAGVGRAPQLYCVGDFGRSRSRNSRTDKGFLRVRLNDEAGARPWCSGPEPGPGARGRREWSGSVGRLILILCRAPSGRQIKLALSCHAPTPATTGHLPCYHRPLALLHTDIATRPPPPPATTGHLPCYTATATLPPSPLLWGCLGSGRQLFTGRAQLIAMHCGVSNFPSY